MTAVRLELLDSDARLRALESEWQRFLDRVPPESPFQRPEWLLTWWSHFGNGRLHVLVFRHADEMVGLMPCFLHDWKGRRQLTLIGSGITDDLEPVLDGRHLAAILDLLAKHLAERSEWDVCDWQDLGEHTPLAVLGAAQEDTPCSRLAIPPSFDGFLQSRPQYLRRNLRHSGKKAAASGAFEFAVAQQAGSRLVEELIELHGARWRESGEPGMIAANGSADFLRDVAGALAKKDMLRIFTMRLEGRVVAIVFGMRNETTLFGYLTAFDPEYKREGFGSELLSRALRYAHENGYRWWDFLRGEEAYKFDWGAERIPKRRVIIERGR